MVFLVLCFFLSACGAGSRQPDYTDELVEDETQMVDFVTAYGKDGVGFTFRICFPNGKKCNLRFSTKKQEKKEMACRG